MPIQAKMPVLTVRAIKATPVEVPLNFVLGTSQQALRQVPLLLIDVETEEGVTGRSYLFCYLRAVQPAIVSLLGEIESLTKGERADPAVLAAKLTRRFTLIGVQGIVRMALAGFDTRLLGRASRSPPASHSRPCWGRKPEPIPAYNSCGLGIKDDLGELAAEAETLAGDGRLPRAQTPARLSDPRRRHRGGARRAQTHRRRCRADGRLQSGALARRRAGARPCARRREYLLAGRADPARRLCRSKQGWCAN